MSIRLHGPGFCLLVACWLYGCTSPPPSSSSDVSPSPVNGSESAQIQSVPAELRRLQDSIVAAGNITADPLRQGQVGSPASGRITEVYAAPGDTVTQGQPLARLHSPDLTRARADREHALLRLQLATRTLAQRRELYRLGDSSQRPVEEARNELAAALGEEQVARNTFELNTRKLNRVRDLLQHGVSTQQELEEAEAAQQQAQSRWRQAQGVLQVARHHREREERLAAGGSLVQTKILEAENEFRLAQEEVSHADEILNDLGSPDENGLLLRAPRSGVVLSSQARLGQAVTADQALFEILDARKLWLWVTLYEADQSRVRTGMPVSVTVEALPGRAFQGRISYLPPVVELPSRSLKARVLVDNPHGLLKVGMAARVTIALGPARQAVMVPFEAVQQGGVVYVGNEPRKVETGTRQGDWIEIRRGVAAGERVVSSGAYLLQSEGP